MVKKVYVIEDSGNEKFAYVSFEDAEQELFSRGFKSVCSEVNGRWFSKGERRAFVRTYKLKEQKP
jgi:hypothetical protein